jgi:hypothetical protein
MSYEPPIKISIPIPNEIPQGFGPNSTGKRGGNLRVRCTNKEYDMIQEEAAFIGVSLATFCRWCSVHVATMLLEHREANSTSMSIGDDEEHGRKPKRKPRTGRNTKGSD